jgi:hypothetical protein
MPHILDRLMTSIPAQGLALVLVCTGIVTVAPARAQENSQRTVEQYECKDILREPDARREVAIAFLHGFLLGKSGGSTFNPQALAKQSNAFIEHCLENPHDKAVKAMMRLKG